MLTSTQSYVTFQGNGSTTNFPYSFPVPKAAYLQVSVTNNNVSPAVTTVLTSSQYAVTGIGNGIPGAANSTPGGTVTYPTSGSPLAAGWTITISRIVPYQQSTQLDNQGGLYPEVVEAALDYLTMQTQQLAGGSGGGSGSQSYIVAPVQIPANASSVSLAGLKTDYVTSNTQATTINAFSDMTPGHRFKIVTGDGYTSIQFAFFYVGLPVGSIIGHQGQLVAFAQGDVIDCVTDGSYVYAIDSKPMVTPVSPLPPSLLISVASNTTLSVTAESVTLPNIAGLFTGQIAAALPAQILSYAVNAATNGAGGLDTGSLAPNTWYYVWLVGDGTNVKAIVSTGRYWTFVTLTYLASYTYARLVGCVLTDANSHFIPSMQIGNEFVFTAPQTITLAAEAAYTACNTGPFPPIAFIGLYQAFFAPASGVATFSFSADGATDYIVFTAPTAGGNGGGQFEVPFMTAQQFWYKNANIYGTPSVSVRGFMLNL